MGKKFNQNTTITKNSKQNKSKKRKTKPTINKNKSQQLYNSICRIYDEKNQKKGTGFFMQIIIDNEPFFLLITSNNIISSEHFDKEETIVIYFITNGKEEKRNIKIDSNRTKFTFFNPLNVTVVEILDSDNISKDRFLYPDLNYKKGYQFYLNKNYYIAGFENYKKINKKYISSFKINQLSFKYTFIYNKNKVKAEFGSLICSQNNLNIVGINNESNSNCGLFMGRIIDILENLKKGIIEEKCEFYKGMFNYGLKHGKGTGYYRDGGLYEGDWINDTREGKGIMYYSNGNIYNGDWKNDRREGKGIFYFCKGGYFEGDFKNNIIDGYGKLISEDGNIEYKGTLKIWGLDNPNFNISSIFGINYNINDD